MEWNISLHAFAAVAALIPFSFGLLSLKKALKSYRV